MLYLFLLCVAGTQRVWERPGRRTADPLRRLPEQQGQIQRRQAAGIRRRGDVRGREEQQGRPWGRRRWLPRRPARFLALARSR